MENNSYLFKCPSPFSRFYMTQYIVVYIIKKIFDNPPAHQPTPHTKRLMYYTLFLNYATHRCSLVIPITKSVKCLLVPLLSCSNLIRCCFCILHKTSRYLCVTRFCQILSGSRRGGVGAGAMSSPARQRQRPAHPSGPEVIDSSWPRGASEKLVGARYSSPFQARRLRTFQINIIPFRWWKI